MNSIAGKSCPDIIPDEEKTDLKDIEKAIIKKYRRKLWSKFIKAVIDFKLVNENDKIAVAISGGKDSILMAKLFQELKRHSKYNFDVVFISMDPGFNDNVREVLLDNCRYLNIPVITYKSNIFDIVDEKAKNYPCYLCARMRRGSLYAKAKELKCNKLALGHHFNDVIETIMLNILYSGNYKTMMPKLKAQNFEGMEIIRPLYYIEEDDIIEFKKYCNIKFLDCACEVAAKKTGNKRFEIKKLIKDLKKISPEVDKSIFKSAQNVDLDNILGWNKNGNKFDFMQEYD
ncbi:tRNA 2-thiocytidine biosynthesis TtcA family protein [Clostridium sp. BJN0001]|uniref:tRNA 2-thiocytidine biosynthesis TtcA family protein n=1 Tax=Clostridium sp. BJN0001 TaxID=2930219 RepID=UPI001FD2D35E|nr:tRNA 2-thiocytidine biosynthesis TtcA family protein [Clostridium sp. BJN0001]